MANTIEECMAGFHAAVSLLFLFGGAFAIIVIIYAIIKND